MRRRNRLSLVNMTTLCGLLQLAFYSGGMFVGLVKDPGAGWGLPDDIPQEPRRFSFTLSAIPWRVLAWLAAFVLSFAVSRVIGGWAGYGLMLAAVAVGSWRLDRQLGPTSRGMRDYQS